MSAEYDVHPGGGGDVDGSMTDRLIAGLAERQHGVVARAQLLELRIGPRAIDHRLAVGRLYALHRGVFAVGHRVIGAEGRWMAAVLAAGDGAALSHRSAGALWMLRPDGRRIDVTVPRQRRARRGVTLHVASLQEDERTVRRGIPVTTAARTLLDLAAVVPRHALERAVHEAEVQRLGDATPLPELVERHRGRRGVARLRAVLDVGAQHTRSDLEARFLALLDDHGLPRPATNVVVEGLEVDCLWRDARLVAELDGHAVHATRRAFEGDRARDRALLAAGLRVVRVTWRQVRDEPGALAADLSALLARTTL
jgi:very-short-patch-repair endonuclease/predicted transcriptional regulator of viral defense system